MRTVTDGCARCKGTPYIGWLVHRPSHYAVSVRSDGAETRERLVRTGERLFAKQGINVPLIDVQRAAQQRNNSALHYYFGSRDGLLNAILERHRSVIEAERVALLEDVERDDDGGDVPGYITALLVPAANRLRSPAGRDYLLILPQVVHRLTDTKVTGTMPAGLRRTLDGIARRLDATAQEAAERTAMIAVTQAALLADRARQVNRRQGRLSHDEFVRITIDVMIGALGPTRTRRGPSAAATS